MGEEKNDNIDSTNIFDEFSNDEKLKKEVKNAQKNTNKGIVYYLKFINNYLKFGNGVFILFFIIFGGYSYLQLNENIDNSNSELLSPFCSILEKDNTDGGCLSVSTDLLLSEEKLKTIEHNQFNKILGMIGSVYELNNFAFSKEVSFLLNKSDNRLNSLFILNEFNNFKNEFEPINKNKLKCENIKITSNGILTINCDAFSSDWDTEIPGLVGENNEKKEVGGTSISYASSFINFLEKKSDKIEILSKPKMFNSVSVIGNFGFTKKTSFKLVIRFKNNNLLLK